MQAKIIAFFILILSSNVLGANYRKDKTDANKSTTATTSSSTTNTTATTTEEPGSKTQEEKGENVDGTKNSKLTGIPQLDWVYDPNLPRELRGYNLSSYPFFSTVPPEEDIHFKCDGLHDGFYAAIEFKCQVYHHCVYGIRHDFLCANFTAFDQKTFICHFVSDVDCEGSKKYWNRNDALYMATTTTTSSTTTTEPPPTQRRRPVRPQRPLRRPLKRRPIDDYYYDEEYEDEYYEEPASRRRIPSRQRPKKPFVEYEDEYVQERPRETENTRRHQNNRNRFRDEVDELEEDYDNPRPHGKTPERRKSGSRVPIAAAAPGRQGNDERRSFADERPLDRPGRKEKPRVTPEEAEAEADDTAYISRRNSGRRRTNEKRLNNVSNIEPDLEEDEFKDEPPRNSPKPLEEYVTPKASSQSVFARPRVPPRIARPVPINEKNKFQYPVQKAGTTPMPSSQSQPEEDVAPEAEYYDEEDYGGLSNGRSGQGTSRRHRIQDSVDTLEERGTTSGRKRFRHEPRNKPQRSRNQLRKPLTEKKVVAPVADYEEYDAPAEEIVERVAPVTNRRPSKGILGRRRSSLLAQAAAAEEEDLVEEDIQPIAVKPKGKLKSVGLRDHRKKLAEVPAAKTPRRPILEEELEEADFEVVEEPAAYVPERRPQTKSQQRRKQQEEILEDLPVDDLPLEDEEAVVIEEKNSPAVTKPPTPVRVVKRPFLPSRGGSPYLPRGLLAVGVAPKSLNSPHPHESNHYNFQSRESVDVDVGPTISTIRMLEHGALVFRHSESSSTGNSHLTTVAPKLQSQKHHNLAINSQDFDAEPENEEVLYDDDDEDVNVDVDNGGIVFEQEQKQIASQLQNQAETEKEKYNEHSVEIQAKDPQATLDMLYENDYDVTINDALNPTLKPLTSIHQNHQRNYPTNSVNNYSASSLSSPNPSSALKLNQSISISNNNNSNNKKSPYSSSSSTSSSSSSSSTISSTSSSNSASVGAVASNHIVKNHQNSLPINQQAQQYYGQQQSATKLYYNNNNNYNNNKNINNNDNNHKNYNHKDDSHFSSTDIRRRAFIKAPSAAATSASAKNNKYASVNARQQQQPVPHAFVGVANNNKNYNSNNNAKHLQVPVQYDDDNIEEEY